VEHRQARHIGDIIKERDNVFEGRTQTEIKSGIKVLPARAGETNRLIRRVQKLLRSLLAAAVWVPLTIGRLVTLPFRSRRVAEWTNRRGPDIENGG
jgi:hypothetical protein